MGWGFLLSFCSLDESIPHMFFGCPAAGYMWGVVCSALGVSSRPSCFTQYFWWIYNFFPGNSNLHIIGIAAFCWAIWKTRNKTCFEMKLISSPAELICYMCVFLQYWAGLQSEGDRTTLVEGASRIQEIALAAHNRA